MPNQVRSSTVRRVACRRRLTRRAALGDRKRQRARARTAEEATHLSADTNDRHAKLLQAKKEAEAQKIAADAENERNMQRLQAQEEQQRLQSEAERERQRIKLEAEVAEAKAIADNPALLKLRELNALGEMAKAGGKFVIGMKGDALSAMTKE